MQRLNNHEQQSNQVPLQLYAQKAIDKTMMKKKLQMEKTKTKHKSEADKEDDSIIENDELVNTIQQMNSQVCTNHINQRKNTSTVFAKASKNQGESRAI